VVVPPPSGAQDTFRGPKACTAPGDLGAREA
jgi:hypothetical protein